LPHYGYYIYDYETTKPTAISRVALIKFNDVPGLAAVYHHGPITIYDTAGLGVAMNTDGFVGTRSMGPSAPVQTVAGAATVVLLVLLLRRRWSVIKRAISNAGIAGSGVAAVAGLVFVGGLLFGLRWIPGPAFTLGAAEMALVLLITSRLASGKTLFPRLRLTSSVHPLVLLGLLGLAIGAVLDLHSAWSVDVTAVDQILRSVTRAK
jgi:hypothetical protein